MASTGLDECIHVYDALSGVYVQLNPGIVLFLIFTMISASNAVVSIALKT